MIAISVQFSIKCCEFTSLGLSQYDAFKNAARYFKKHLTGILIQKRKEAITKTYFFNDDSCCVYNHEGNYFNYKS